MPVKDCTTELHIKETAKRIFFKEGKMLATTQEIADAAGVNRTLLHYYFRSKDALFEVVFKEALLKLRQGLHTVIESKDPFRIKIERFIGVFFEELVESPYLESFIVLQVNEDPDKYKALFVEIPGARDRINGFLQEIRLEMEKGTIPEMDPVQFYISMFSLMAYPMIAKPIYQNLFQLSETDFARLSGERKKIIMSLLFRA